jgi:hypothetical protein
MLEYQTKIFVVVFLEDLVGRLVVGKACYAVGFCPCKILLFAWKNGQDPMDTQRAGQFRFLSEARRERIEFCSKAWSMRTWLR